MEDSTSSGVFACLSPKGLTVFSPRGNALIEGRVKVDGQGSAMNQQRRGVLVQFGGRGVVLRQGTALESYLFLFNIESFFSSSGNYIASQIQGQRIQTGCEREG